jgi:hypothetical protein
MIKAIAIRIGCRLQRRLQRWAHARRCKACGAWQGLAPAATRSRLPSTLAWHCPGSKFAPRAPVGPAISPWGRADANGRSVRRTPRPQICHVAGHANRTRQRLAPRSPLAGAGCNKARATLRATRRMPRSGTGAGKAP